MVITRPALTVLVLCLSVSLGWAAKPNPVKAKQSAAKARTATRKASFKPSKRVVKYRKPVARRVSAPKVPGNERLREVQIALIERGYLEGEANGIWNAKSVDALKRFEAEQNTKVDGKIDSKMLIALGLGPQYDSNLSLPVPNGSSGQVVAADQSNNNDPRN